jgi:hypothetical protein
MATVATRRLRLVVSTQGITVSGDGLDKPHTAPWTDGAKLDGMSRFKMTKAVEAVLAKISSAAFKAGTRPMNWTVVIVAPQKMDYGYQHYGLHIDYEDPAPAVVPNPKAKARRAKAAA